MQESQNNPLRFAFLEIAVIAVIDVSMNDIISDNQSQKFRDFMHHKGGAEKRTAS